MWQILSYALPISIALVVWMLGDKVSIKIKVSVSAIALILMIGIAVATHGNNGVGEEKGNDIIPQTSDTTIGNSTAELPTIRMYQGTHIPDFGIISGFTLCNISEIEETEFNLDTINVRANGNIHTYR
jgi:hypothetical protein